MLLDNMVKAILHLRFSSFMLFLLDSPKDPVYDLRLMNNAVVVWEYESHHCGKWKPYSAIVCQFLERAYSKKLTKALLSDADPNYATSYVNFKLWMQVSDECSLRVRRKLFSTDCCAAKGVQWQWSNSFSDEWHVFDMEVQCVLELACSQNLDLLDLSRTELNLPYVVDFKRFTQIKLSNGTKKRIRRNQQAPYPLTKVKLNEVVYKTIKWDATNVTKRMYGTNPDLDSGPNKSNKLVLAAYPFHNKGPKFDRIDYKMKRITPKHESATKIAKALLNILGMKNTNNRHVPFENESTASTRSDGGGNESCSSSEHSRSIDTTSTYFTKR